MIRYRQYALDVLFVTTEVVVWFMVLRVVISMSVGTFWTDVARNLERAINAGDLANPERAQALLPLVRDAADGASGVPFLVLLGAALGAFALERGISRTGMDGPMAAVALLLGSILALNIVYRLAAGGDLRFWDLSGVGSFFQGDQARTASQVDFDQLVASGSVDGLHGSAMAMSVGGVTLLWIRFLIAARAEVDFPRVLRSVSIGLALAMVTMIAAAMAGVPGIPPFAVAHFVLGVLVLAVANNARAYIPADGEARGVTPWLVAVSGTVGVLVGVAMLIALLAFLNAGAAFAYVGSIALQVVEVVLFIIITPLYWALERLVGLFFSDGLPGIGQDVGPEEPLEPPTAAEGDGITIPGWATNLMRTMAVLAFVVMLYYLARLIVSRRRPSDPAVAEVRSRGSGGASFGQVLRDLLPHFRHDDPDAWMARHPVYRLYGRTLASADERGFAVMAGETPIEFSERAQQALAAPFPDVGRAFDRARYGRHFPADEDVNAMERRVAEWERATPATRELRESLHGAGPMDETAEIQLRIERRRAAALGDAERVRRLGEDETR